MTADRARGALAVLQDADGKFICEVPCGYIVEQTASTHKPRRIQAQRRRRAMLRRRVALTVALLTVAALLAALMPWSGSGATDKPKEMIRRFLPKGTDFRKVTAAYIQRVETWINNYPCEILGFETSGSLFERYVAEAA